MNNIYSSIEHNHNYIKFAVELTEVVNALGSLYFVQPYNRNNI